MKNLKQKTLRRRKRFIRLIGLNLTLLLCGLLWLTLVDFNSKATVADRHTEPNAQLVVPENDPVTPAPASRFSAISAEDAISRIPILMYHDVQDVPSSDDNNVMPLHQFEAQLQYLHANGFTTLTTSEFIAAYTGELYLPPKSILITFDDGFQSIRTLIDPLLAKYDFYATSFIVGSYTERPDWHLTQAQIAEVAANSRIDFQSHTFDLHQDGVEKGLINEVDAATISRDQQAMTALLGYEPQILCYPFGAFSDNAIAGLTAANIPFGFAIHSGSSNWVYLNETHTTAQGEVQDPRALPRVRINANITLDTFTQLITD